MDCEKFGTLVRTLRTEKHLTQLQLAEKLNLSDKTISKWERGLGLPDISMLPLLSQVFGVNIGGLLNGDLSLNTFVGGNMKKSKYYVCPTCGNITLCTGNAEVSCCGRKLSALEPIKAADDKKLNVEKIENEWYITSSHPMTKDDYISFVAFATGERIEIIKQYPEWNLQAYIPSRQHGMLIFYSAKLGLLYQLI